MSGNIKEFGTDGPTLRPGKSHFTLFDGVGAWGYENEVCYGELPKCFPEADGCWVQFLHTGISERRIDLLISYINQRCSSTINKSAVFSNVISLAVNVDMPWQYILPDLMSVRALTNEDNWPFLSELMDAGVNLHDCVYLLSLFCKDGGEVVQRSDNNHFPVSWEVLIHNWRSKDFRVPVNDLSPLSSGKGFKSKGGDPISSRKVIGEGVYHKLNPHPLDKFVKENTKESNNPFVPTYFRMDVNEFATKVSKVINNI